MLDLAKQIVIHQLEFGEVLLRYRGKRNEIQIQTPHVRDVGLEDVVRNLQRNEHHGNAHALDCCFEAASEPLMLVGITAEDGDVAATQDGTAIFGDVTLTARVGHTREASNQEQHKISYDGLKRLDELGLPHSQRDGGGLGGACAGAVPCCAN